MPSASAPRRNKKVHKVTPPTIKWTGQRQTRYKIKQSGVEWASVSTQNVQAQTFTSKRPDLASDVDKLRSDVEDLFRSGVSHVRVSQSYDNGIGHTFALKLGEDDSGKKLTVIDHVGSDIYDRGVEGVGYWQYNKLIDDLSVSLPASRSFAPKDERLKTDETYQKCKKTGLSPCVYYIDEYVYMKNI